MAKTNGDIIVAEEPCGCSVIEANVPGFPLYTSYCPLHKSAPDLYEALLGLMEALEKHGSEHNDIRVAYNLAKPALTKAEGK